MARTAREPRLIVRDARPEDFEVLERVFVEAGRAAWAHILPPEGLTALRFAPRWREAGDVLVAGLDGQPVGFAVIDGAELDAFYTHPSVWGRGAGQALMAEALARFRATDVPEAFLWTAETNGRPRRFYEAAGWETTGERAERERYGARYVELRYRIRP